LFPGARSTELDDVTDGKSNTLIIVEVADVIDAKRIHSLIGDGPTSICIFSCGDLELGSEKSKITSAEVVNRSLARPPAYVFPSSC
jgi:hypothetical protein